MFRTGGLAVTVVFTVQNVVSRFIHLGSTPQLSVFVCSIGTSIVGDLLQGDKVISKAMFASLLGK